ncbi:MAG: ABC transporter substrate-binding protein, partial [Bacillota bacterium]
MMSLGKRWMLSVLLVTAVLAGAALSAAAQAQEPVTIRYWQYYFQTKGELIDELIAGFEAQNPGIRVI